MSEIRVNSIQNESADGAVNLIYGAQVPTGMGITGAGGINITGVATAGSFSGNLTGNATGLTGTPDVTVGNVNAGIITATTFVGVPAGFTELDAALFN